MLNMRFEQVNQGGLMFVRAFVSLLAACTLATAAYADTSYTVFAPTTEPYQRFDNVVSAGNFTDSFNFTLTEATTGYIWLFPRQNATNGLDQVSNLTNVSLLLVNNDTEKQVAGVLYTSLLSPIPNTTPGVLDMIAAGFDPNLSLGLRGVLTPGNYSALVSGTATGSQGGDYFIKFSLAPAVPEASTSAMMLVGLATIGLVASRRRKQAH
jgi:hypothetical protein